AGVNRFSLGVQTFDEELLKLCGRSHSRSDVMQGVELIKQLGIENFSLDLISGLPHQTLEHCQQSLDQAIAIAPQHLSCYDLVLEPVTAFGKQYQPGKTPLPQDEDTAQMYRLTQQTLTAAGYEHYEISNYAQSRYQCRHNRVYWENKPYYGFGMGAASYVAGKRFSRPRTRREYYAWLTAGAIIDVPQISPTDYLLETLMLGLRLREGVDLTQFSYQIRQAILSCIIPYWKRGWVEITTEDGQLINVDDHPSNDLSGTKLRLTDPEGFLFSNTILAAMFEELD
ncbi:MAG: radical SAM family heme chaperone HemW, partial [Waterburya sp.]